MNKFAVLLWMICSFSSCVYNGESVRGSGKLIKQERNVSAFEAVQSHGSFDVFVSSGAVSSVEVEAEDNLQQYIEVVVDGQTLNIRAKDGYSLDPEKTIKVFIVAPRYTALKTYGSGNITGQTLIISTDKIDLGISGSGDIALQLQVPKVSAEVTGSGDIKVSGTAKEFESDINGSGDITAKDLVTSQADISITGSGNTSIAVSHKLTVTITGSGDVSYKGNPRIDNHITGSGSINAMN